jgi:hypothetical protein
MITHGRKRYGIQQNDMHIYAGKRNCNMRSLGVLNVVSLADRIVLGVLFISVSIVTL